MNFIVCYSCALKPNKELANSFLVSSCGKLFCSTRCKQNYKCRECRDGTCQVIKIVDAPNSVKEFFVDFKDTFTKNQKVYEYQLNLIQVQYSLSTTKYNRLKSEYLKMQEELNKLKRDNKRLQDYIKNLITSNKTRNPVISPPTKAQLPTNVTPNQQMINATFRVSQTPAVAPTKKISYNAANRPRQFPVIPANNVSNRFQYRSPQNQTISTQSSVYFTPQSTTNLLSPNKFLSKFFRRN